MDLSRQSNGKLSISLWKLQCICLTLNMRYGNTTFYICLYPIFNERDLQKFDTVSVTGEITCNDAKPCFSLDYLTFKYSCYVSSSTRVGLVHQCGLLMWNKVSITLPSNVLARRKIQHNLVQNIKYLNLNDIILYLIAPCT